MLARALKMALWVTYDHLGKILVVSMVWAVGTIFPAALGILGAASGQPGARLIGWPLLLGALMVGLPVISAGIASMVKEIIETREGSMRTFVAGMGAHWRRATALGGVYTIAVVALLTSVWFYATRLQDSVPWLGMSLSILAGWLLLFTVLSAFYAIPALVQRKLAVFGTLRLAAGLVLDNSIFTVGLLVATALYTVLAVFFTPLVFFFYGGVVVVIATSAYEVLARKYAILEHLEREGYDEAARRRAISRRRWIVREGEAQDPLADVWRDEQDDFLNRGMRDFFFPWKE